MPTEAATERRALKAAQLGATPPFEQEHLPCPRCDSTNTKFCYYNNYNYSQPRHFCKSCRRYWTQGGTLRDIPVGGGTRRNSSKRSRTLPSAAALTSSTLATTTTASGLVSGITNASCNSPSFTGNRNAVGCSSVMEAVPAGGPIFVSLPGTVGPYMSDVPFSKLSGCGPTGSFTSLLSGSGNGAGLLAFGGFGLGLGPGFEDTGLLARGVWPFQEVGYLSGGGSGGSSGGGIGGGMNGGGEGGLGGNSWQLESGDGGYVGVDSISWPELAISTPGNGVS